jgi:hypothetical protein
MSRTPEKAPLSLHWELQALLASGVLLLSSGLGIWVYKNLGYIDRLAIVGALALISGGGFALCFRGQPRFSPAKVTGKGIGYDYLLLLACLTFVTLIGYLQYQYALFGPNPRLATFVPLLVLFGAAYYFDHLGVLSLAITNLAAFLGIVVTPLDVFKSNDFNSVPLIYTGVLLAIFLWLVAKGSERSHIKSHFAFTYMQFAIHIGCIAALAGMVHYDASVGIMLLWLLLLGAMSYVIYAEALRRSSFYFILLLGIYTYIGLAIIVFKVLNNYSYQTGSLQLALAYLVGSAIVLAFFLVSKNKQLKHRHGNTV